MMSRTILILLAFVLISGPAHSVSKEPVAVTCKFEKLPPMVMTIRGGMGAADNTLTVGKTPPVPLEIGSGLSTASHDGRDFIFSLREPASVTVIRAGAADQTYRGTCKSSLRP